MPGAETYRNTWLGVDFVCYWQDSPTECPSPITVADWLRELWDRYQPWMGGLKRIEVWSPRRAAIGTSRDGGWIARAAGLTYPDGVILLNATFANRGCLAHEVGHWADMARRLLDATDAQGQAMAALWRGLRGWEATAATPPAERWAEDFRALFGGPGVGGTVNVNDDGQRKPWDVEGLKTFMAGFAPVLAHWRRQAWISTASYADGAWQWVAPVWWFWSRWERCEGGQFSYWDGARWVTFAA